MKRLTVLVWPFCVAMVVATGAQVRPASRPTSGASLAAVRAAADPALSAPFFDGSVLQEVRLDMNSKDWQTLRQNYLSNAYYPADFHWGSQVVRNIGIRSRGTASRSEVKPGLRVDFNRYADDQTF